MDSSCTGAGYSDFKYAPSPPNGWLVRSCANQQRNYLRITHARTLLYFEGNRTNESTRGILTNLFVITNLAKDPFHLSFWVSVNFAVLLPYFVTMLIASNITITNIIQVWWFYVMLLLFQLFVLLGSSIFNIYYFAIFVNILNFVSWVWF